MITEYRELFMYHTEPYPMNWIRNQNSRRFMFITMFILVLFYLCERREDGERWNGRRVLGHGIPDPYSV